MEHVIRELTAWRDHDACPSCGLGTYTTAIGDEDTYSDDEQLIMLDGRPQYTPYKDYVCEKCGHAFRVYLGAIAIHELEDGEPI